MRQASEQSVDLIDKIMQEYNVTKEQIEAGLKVGFAHFSKFQGYNFLDVSPY